MIFLSNNTQEWHKIREHGKEQNKRTKYKNKKMIQKHEFYVYA